MGLSNVSSISTVDWFNPKLTLGIGQEGKATLLVPTVPVLLVLSRSSIQVTGACVCSSGRHLLALDVSLLQVRGWSPALTALTPDLPPALQVLLDHLYNHPSLQVHLVLVPGRVGVNN